MSSNKPLTGQSVSESVLQHGIQPDEDGNAAHLEVVSSATPRCIAICTVGELFGGVERHVLGMLSALRARSISTLLILFHDGELAAQARGQGIEPVILPNRNWFLLTSSRMLAQILEQRKVRVLHVHGYKATVFCALAQRWYPFALVKTEHGLPEPMAGSPIRALRNRLYSGLDTIATRISASMVCYVTEDLRNYYRQAHSGLRVMVIPNGVQQLDRSQFPRPAELREDWVNLLLVGRLDMVKGHHIAIEAMANETISPDIHLHLLGLGPREEELRDLADSLGVAQRIHMLGFRRNVYDYIAYCDAVLMPSLHEGLPYILLEAMAFATPIIASRVGGLAEVLQDEATGLLIPPQDVTALAQAIRQLHDNPALGSQLGERARHLQQTKYSLEAMTKSYLAVYRTLTTART